MKRWGTRAVVASMPVAMVALGAPVAVAEPVDCDGFVAGQRTKTICSIVTDNGLANADIVATWTDALGSFGIVNVNEVKSQFGPALQDLDPFFKNEIRFSVNGGAFQRLDQQVATSATVDGRNASIRYEYDIENDNNPDLQFDVRYLLLANPFLTQMFTVVEPRNISGQAIDLALTSYTDLDLFCPVGCDPEFNDADDPFTWDEEIRAFDATDNPSNETLLFRQVDRTDDGDLLVLSQRYFKQEDPNRLPVNFDAGQYTTVDFEDVTSPPFNSFLLRDDDFVLTTGTSFVDDPTAYFAECEIGVNNPDVDPTCEGPDFAFSAQYLETLAPNQLITMRWTTESRFQPAILQATGTDVGVTQVPAPGALACLAVGLLAAATAVRRRAA